MFQHTAARGRLVYSVHSVFILGCFNTQPPEGGWTVDFETQTASHVSTHSRPRAAGGVIGIISPKILFQHTAARGRLEDTVAGVLFSGMFQHTAARGRLEDTVAGVLFSGMFQHTAARGRLDQRDVAKFGGWRFNTQPPEGGWRSHWHYFAEDFVSTHSRPRAAGTVCDSGGYAREFQHTAARGRLAGRRT